MKNSLKWIQAVVGIFMLCSLAVQAQHETGADLVSGERAFRDFCANCHGPDGDLIAQVDLGHNNFRQPYTDAELAGIILNGIPGTPMPPTPRVTPEQADMLVAYLRSLGDNNDDLAGNAQRGQQLFAGKGHCLDCHMVNGIGAVLGPDLSSIALVRASSELEDSLLNPDAVVQPDNRFYTVQTRDGEQVSGRLLTMTPSACNYWMKRPGCGHLKNPSCRPGVSAIRACRRWRASSAHRKLPTWWPTWPRCAGGHRNEQ